MEGNQKNKPRGSGAGEATLCIAEGAQPANNQPAFSGREEIVPKTSRGTTRQQRSLAGNPVRQETQSVCGAQPANNQPAFSGREEIVPKISVDTTRQQRSLAGNPIRQETQSVCGAQPAFRGREEIVPEISMDTARQQRSLAGNPVRQEVGRVCGGQDETSSLWILELQSGQRESCDEDVSVASGSENSFDSDQYYIADE